MWYVYVLRSAKDGLKYTGVTNDLQKRYAQHQSGEVFSTKHRRPLCLIYYEACIHKTDAYAREKYLKTGMGKRYLNNRLDHYLSKKEQV